MKQLTTLHAVIDPLCGWCYAAAPLLELAKYKLQLPIKLHNGGLLIGQNTRKITPDWADYVKPHDEHIHEISGQVFGDDYYNGLLKNERITLDSSTPIKALLAAQELNADDLALLLQIQKNHYQQGKSATEIDTLIESALSIGIDKDQFLTSFESISEKTITEHISLARNLMQKYGGHGFPTIALETTSNNIKQLHTISP